MRTGASLSAFHPAHSRSASPHVLAVEIGGTTIRAGSAHRGDSEARIERIPTPNYLTHPGLGAMELLSLLATQVAQAARAIGAADPEAVVIAWPGPVIEGLALRSPTILGPALDRRHDVAAQFRAHFPGARVHVLNDLTCAGYHYVSRGLRDFCIVTVGSGIGNKVFLGGEPLIGEHGFGGEIGHLRMRAGPGTPLTAHTVELGSVASGRGTLWLARGSSGSFGAPMAHAAVTHEESAAFVAAFRSGERHAVSIVEEGAYPLAVALGALHLAIGLMNFVLVGGFAKALGDDYRRLLVRLCRELTWDVGQDWDRMIVLGEADVDEGLSGAMHFGSHQAPAALQC